MIISRTIDSTFYLKAHTQFHSLSAPNKSFMLHFFYVFLKLEFLIGNVRAFHEYIRCHFSQFNRIEVVNFSLFDLAFNLIRMFSIPVTYLLHPRARFQQLFLIVCSVAFFCCLHEADAVLFLPPPSVFAG